ncbi:YbaB/EbfC family nucleoid-associated protein [Nocardia sp. NBC_00416]|uniref:YbaB/EbfC family nucleoid-associated protein n=1 Tax=Nocardia sp. NBC_00416 TaxID=2975991 RepID=UPI002E24A311
MDKWESDGMRFANYGMRKQIESMLDTFEAQQAQVPEVFARLAQARITARSSDGLIEVTVDGSGGLAEVRVEPDALRLGAQELSRVVTAVGKEATRLAEEQRRELAAPLLDGDEAVPDLPDLVPGAHSLRELGAAWDSETEQDGRAQDPH